MATLELLPVRPNAPDVDPTPACPHPGAPEPLPDDRPRTPIMIFWCALIAAIAIDVAATFALAASNGFRQFLPSALAVAGFLVTTYLFGVAISGLGPSVSYAVFGALGTAAVAGFGMVAGESASWAKVGALTLIVAGVVLLPVTERL